MSNRLIPPTNQYLDDTGQVLSGGWLYFYLTGTTTPTDTYTTSALSVANSNPVELDSAGRPTADIWLDPAVTYKIVLKDSRDNTIWTFNSVSDPAANVTAAFQVYAGNPTGFVAGSAGTVGGTGASVVWDITNQLLYVCTTTGTTSTAVWTQQGASLAGALVLSSAISPTALSANQNDYAPTGFSTCSQLRQDQSAAYTITGLAGGSAGRWITFYNISSYQMTLSAESSSSTAANRFAFNADVILWPGHSIQLWYDTASSRWRRMGAAYNAPSAEPGGRLTLTSATPVLTSDVTAATTIYYTAYKSNFINLWNGSTWYTVAFSELSQTLADATKSPAAGAVSSVYDMFVWNDSGTLRCTRGPAWSSATSRGTGAGTTELERVNGVWMNKVAVTNGPAANRGVYVGTIATSASGANGQMNMMFAPSAAAGGSANRLDVWNYYNRVMVSSMVRDSTDSWSYTTATWRSANNSTSNRVTIVAGMNEDHINAEVSVVFYNSNSVTARVALGLDSTTAISGLPGAFKNSATAQFGWPLNGRYRGLLGLGSHYLQWLEYSEASGTTTWTGDNGEPTNAQSGIVASWPC